MTGTRIHGFSKRELFRKALSLRDQGRLLDLGNSYFGEAFPGSVDRFCEIACHLRYS